MRDMDDVERFNRRPRERKRTSADNAEWLTGESWEDIRTELERSLRTGRKQTPATNPKGSGKGKRPPARTQSTGAGRRRNPREGAQPNPPNQRKKTPGTSGRQSAETPTKTRTVQMGAGKKGAGEGKSAQAAKSRRDGHKPPRSTTSKQPTGREGFSFWWKSVGAAILLVALLIAVYYIYQQFQVVTKNMQASATTVAEIEDTLAVPVCQPGDLEIATSSNATTLQVGSHWIVTVDIKNKSARSCYLEGGANRFGISLKSGDVNVYESLNCAAEEAQIPLLLNPNKSWKMNLTWDAKVWSNCQAGAVAEPGTYVATISHVDKLIDKNEVLTLVPKPEPKPVEKPAEDKTEKPAEKPAG
ncbi:hypothetical protein NXS08_04095 [Gleimia sp. 6138-11-ORH1]|uniref:hypothetical protein n=1 Tax=Gleimia sp. 6138-11-ORH1 TaxID=2973937 RepID=UPI00216A4EFA|nr:hypothetical protein [Gleimia sp. 6138-11-ORH1]MCS4484667.1 hypothetical protein [Gleimia sp. 6138-11-ORH1]